MSYDVKGDRIIDVEAVNFDCGKMIYKMPAGLGSIVKGDIILHNGSPIFVQEVEPNKVLGVDPVNGEVRCIMPAVSPFGFDFVTKIVNLADSFGTPATADNPFGNILPFILMEKNLDPMALMMMMGNKEIDPMMMLLLNGGTSNDAMMAYLMMKGTNK